MHLIIDYDDNDNDVDDDDKEAIVFSLSVGKLVNANALTADGLTFMLVKLLRCSRRQDCERGWCTQNNNNQPQ